MLNFKINYKKVDNMKNIKIFSLLCLALVFFACKDDLSRSPGGPIGSVPPVLNAPGQGSVEILTPDAETKNPFLLRINWSKARFSYENGLPAEVTDVTYTLEMDVLGNLFARPVTVAITDLLYTDLYSNPLTALIKGLIGATDIEEAQYLDFRVKATWQENGKTAEPLYSNSVTLTATPYVEPVIPPDPEEADEVMIQWKQVEGDWTEFAIYAWGDAPVFGNWPGTKVYPDADGWYAVVIPKNRPINLILNNNNGGNDSYYYND